MSTKMDTFDDARDLDRNAPRRPLVFTKKDEPGGTCSACRGPLSVGVKIAIKRHPRTYHLLCPECCESIGRAAGMVRR